MIYKLLLVEDDRSTSEALSEVLASVRDSVSFIVTAVHSVAECLAELARTDNSYDIILLDLQLPNGKGEFTFLRIYEAANLHIGQPDENRTPIVILTGSSQEFSSLVLKGAMDVLYKPVDGAELRHRLWLAILNFSFRRTMELHQEIKEIASKA